jgi:drug/metabolite transporter (DMT)-like permease
MAIAKTTPTVLRETPAALPLAAALLTMALWGSAFVVVRALGDHYPAGSLALGRLAVGVLALTPFALRRRVLLPGGATLGLVAVYGALWFGVYTILLNRAEQSLDAGTTALLVNTAPILIAVVAGLAFGEGLCRPLIVGLAVAFGGVLLVAQATSTGRHDLRGVLLALGCAACYAAGVLIQKRALATVDPVIATWLGCLFGLLVCVPFASSLVETVSSAPIGATAGVVYLGLFPTAVAFSSWAYALANTGAGRLSASSYLVPAISILLAWAALGEVPPALALVGGWLCLVGVAITRLPSRGGTWPRPVSRPSGPPRRRPPDPPGTAPYLRGRGERSTAGTWRSRRGRAPSGRD